MVIFRKEQCSVRNSHNLSMSNTLIITGGSSGIGKATAQLFAARGYKVYELSRSGKSADESNVAIRNLRMISD